MKKLETIVKAIMEDYPTTRGNDNALIAGVFWLIDADLMNKPFKEVLKMKGLPSFESITRARRKVQEKNPILVNEKARKARQKEEKEYREYYSKKMEEKLYGNNSK